MRTIEEFKSFYEQAVQPQLVELDRKRRKVALAVVLCWLVFIGCLAALFAVGSLFEKSSSFPWPGVVAAFGLFYGAYFTWITVTKKKGKFIDEFKRVVIGGIVTFVDPALTYSPDRMILQNVYDASRLFLKRYDRYAGDDYVAGTIGKTPIEFSELHTAYKVEQETQQGRREKWYPIFGGLFFKCEFNKSFRGQTFVFPDKAERRLGRFGLFLQGLDKSHGQLVTLEDVEFEKRFAVYGDDQIEARYVLSTSLMERLTTFHDKMKQGVCLSFVQSNLYVAIASKKRLFEPRIFRTLVNYKACRAYFDDLQLAAGIVDDLNLNTRIWGEKAYADG